MPIELSIPRHPGRFTYWREITAVLCLKVIGLTVLYFLFFSPAHQMVPTQQDVAHHLIDRTMANTAER
ncbi:MAG: cytochrome oxidase putative small subunit CydP [Methylovirgula sp.]